MTPNLSYEMRLIECVLATLDRKILRGDQILNEYENIDRIIFYRLNKIEGLEDIMLY